MSIPAVSFYVLTDTEVRARNDVACRLAAKAFSEGIRTLIRLPDEAAASSFDDLMWERPLNRFLPHARIKSKDAHRVRTWISTGSESEYEAQLLINLTNENPPNLGNFNRIIEIVSQANTQESRAKYRFYRTHGCVLNTYEISD